MQTQIYLLYTNHINKMKKLTLFVLVAALGITAHAENAVTETEKGKAFEEIEKTDVPEFESEERLEDGFITHYINSAIASAMPEQAADAKVEYGRKVTDYVSAPKVGGYFIGKYAYTNQRGKNTGNGFSQRLVRMYVDGKILNDFAYRVQVQTNNDKFHIKDYFIEWQRYTEFRVKIGQFKRAFGLENPMNPWDVGVGDYSQLTKMLTGHADRIGGESTSNGGRDQGVQIQGDLFPMQNDGRRLLHYQLMIANGQGINCGDNNSRKDVIGTLQIQPVKGLWIGAYGWTGSYTNTAGVTVDRNRYIIAARYDKNDWSFRAEYGHSTGYSINDYLSETIPSKADDQNLARADAWYATLGVPCTPWLKTFVKYDVYREYASWGKAKSIYSISPNIQIHKNLMFQPQFNYVHDRNLSKKDYCELWLETYVRF